MLETALSKLSYGLYIISSIEYGKDVGCVANTLHQVTSNPIQVSITLHKDNYTKQVIERTKKFNAVVLSENIDMNIIKTFGFTSSRDTNKYKSLAIRRDSFDIPYLTKDSVAYITCKVVTMMDIGTHVIFIGEVIESDIISDDPVMTYNYYHQVKNGGTPKNAPSYQAQVEKKGWRCSICGYIYEGDPLPSDYICPLCGAPASVFEKI